MSADIVILGAWKCGSSSLEAYLRKEHPDKEVAKNEIFYMPDGRLNFQNLPDTHYYVILQKNKDRFYHSIHEYFFPHKTFKEVMSLKNVKNSGMSVVELADWERHIERWTNKVKHLHILWLEDMATIEGFPHLNHKGVKEA